MRPLYLLLLLGRMAVLWADETVPPGGGAPAGEAALFGDMPVVEAASLHAQTLAEAPASVTVITASDIRKYGYRTLADVLAGARGFTVTNDYLTRSSGVRGFAVPGDYNTCFLVMINGHAMTEIAADSNGFFGQDFGLDLDLVERIEIIRGPVSALYGSNGILATINLVTRAPVDSPRMAVSTETGNGAPQKAQMMASLNLGKGANLLIAGSGFYTRGRSLAVPEFGASEAGGSLAHRVEGEGGYHTFLNLQWRGWNFTGYFNDHLQRAPILGSGTIFDDQGQFLRVARNFAGAAYTHDFANGGVLRWQIYFDQFRLRDRYDYPFEPGPLDNRDSMRGDWLDSQVSYSYPLPRVGLLTVGLSGKLELQNVMENVNYWPERGVNLRVSDPDRTLAPFIQQEWNFSKKVTLYLGLRFDQSYNYGGYFSPRAALVYQPTPRTSYKLVYGRPFRTPSLFEAYYQDGVTQVRNPHLRAETAQALEASAERKIGKAAYVLVNAYHYALHSVIESVWYSDLVLQYQNSGARSSNGIEFEVGGHLKSWLETTASLTLDHAVDADHRVRLPNAPARMAKARGAVPVFRDRIYFSTELLYLGSRLTLSHASTRPVAVVNATLSTVKLFHGFDLVAGVRNALNWSYKDPTALPMDSSADQMPAYGRSAFLKLIWRPGE